MDEIVLNERYGCMEVLDLGEEYNEKHPDEENTLQVSVQVWQDFLFQ